MEHFSNRAFLKWSNSQIEHFSNGAILKWSILGSPPYAIFQDPKNREIWHAMCYSKLVEVLTVAHVDTEGHVGNSLLQILKLRFGHEVKFC